MGYVFFFSLKNVLKAFTCLCGHVWEGACSFSSPHRLWNLDSTDHLTVLTSLFVIPELHHLTFLGLRADQTTPVVTHSLWIDLCLSLP